MIRSAWARIPALYACYALAALLLFRGPFLGNRSWFDSGDSALQSWPWLLAVADAARHGHLLLWEFGSQAGVSLAGELQPGPFYPPTWLLGLSGLQGLGLCNAYVLLHFALAATGMHMLLRGERLLVAASVLGAALFAFAGYLPFQANAQPNIFASLCWMPLVLFAARRAFAATDWRSAALPAMLAGLCGGSQIAAGHMQPFVHTSYAVMLCAMVSALHARTARPILFGLMAQATALCFAAVPLWLADQYLHLVYRWYADGMSRWPHAVPAASYATGAALRWSDLRGLLHPGTLAEQDGSLYLGLAAAPLALLGLATAPLALFGPAKVPLARFSPTTAPLARFGPATASLASFDPAAAPLARSDSVRRSSFALSMAALALFGLLLGLGGHAGAINRLFAHLPLLSQLRTPIRAACLLSLAAAALAACGLDLIGDLSHRLGRTALARSTPEVELHRSDRSRAAVPAETTVLSDRHRALLAAPSCMLLALCCWQIAAFDGGVGRSRANPQFAPTYYDHNPALDAVLRLSGQQPHTAPLVDRILCVPRDLIPPNAGDVAPLLNVMGQRATMMVSLFDTLSQGWGPATSTPLDRLGVRWVVSDHPIDGLALRAQGPGFRIYERPDSLSVLWTLSPDGLRARAPVVGADWGDDTVRFEIAPVQTPTRLVFAQPFYPGWHASVDGRRVQLGQVDGLDAIDLPDGAVSIRFSYQPNVLVPVLVTIAAIALLGALLVARATRHARKRPAGAA